MDDPFDNLLSQRIRASASTQDDSDWLDVQRRTQRSSPTWRRTRRSSPKWRRPRVGLIAAALVVAVGALAAPGWGLGFRIVDLFSGETAPPDVQQVVHGADVGAPAGMAPGIEANQTHKLVAISLSDGRQATLWVAPTESGGLCEYVQRGSISGGPGCGPSEAPTNRIDWSIQGRAEHDNTVLIYGRVPVTAQRLDLSFGDGATIELTLTKGFFLYEIPADHTASNARPSALTAYDIDGNEVAHTSLLLGPVYGVFDSKAPPGAP